MNYLINGFEEELEKIAFLKKEDLKAGGIGLLPYGRTIHEDDKDSKGKGANLWRLGLRLAGSELGSIAGFLAGQKLIAGDVKAVFKGTKRPSLAMYAKSALPVAVGAFLGEALGSKIYREKFGKNNRKYSK